MDVYALSWITRRLCQGSNRTNGAREWLLSGDANRWRKCPYGDTWLESATRVVVYLAARNASSPQRVAGTAP
jgi:hypothetical protein